MASSAFAGTGTQADPYTVDDVIALCPSKAETKTQTGVYVQGVIVGTIPTTASMTYLEYTEFSAKDANPSNLVLGGAKAEDDYKYCMTVQLLSGSDVRKVLNLKDNPNNIGHTVLVCGDIEWYCGGPGLKNTSFYEWVGEAPTPGGGSSSGSDSGYLVDGMDDFTIDNVNLPSELSYVWSWDSQYGAKASAFYNSTNYATESILISPEITLPADAQAATFSQALNYLNGNNRADFVNVVVREGSNGAWTVANVSAWPAGNGWGFVDNCTIDLTAYAGKTIQIGFKYTSSNSCAPTWEVKRLVVGGTVNNPGGETPGGNLSGECVAFVADGYSYTGTAQQVVIISGTQDAGNTIFDKTWNADGICSLSFINNNSNMSYVTNNVVRWYKDCGITINPEVTVTGLRMESDATYNQVCPNGSCNLTAINGTPWTVVSTTEAIWSGSLDSEFSFANTAQVRFKYLEVYYGGEDNGVEEILAADDSEAVYFNLQGQKVNNPERGIFVKVVNGKAIKVVK